MQEDVAEKLWDADLLGMDRKAFSKHKDEVKKMALALSGKKTTEVSTPEESECPYMPEVKQEILDVSKEFPPKTEQHIQECHVCNSYCNKIKQMLSDL